MDLGLRGRVALITGSSDGIGSEIAFRLAEEGADVIIHGKNPDKVIKTAETIRKAVRSTMAYAFPADVTNPEEVNTSFKEVMSRVGHLDILVNNLGGVPGIKKFEEETIQEWREIINYNLITPVMFTQLALPFLKKSNQARIIFLGSIPALQPGANNARYGAAKVGVVHLSKHLSNELAGYGITVNAILPNTIMGGSWYRNIERISKNEGVTLEEAAEKLEKSTLSKMPSKRMGTPADVAYMVAILAAKQASYITGACIPVDGGTKRAIF